MSRSGLREHAALGCEACQQACENAAGHPEVLPERSGQRLDASATAGENSRDAGGGTQGSLGEFATDGGGEM